MFVCFFTKYNPVYLLSKLHALPFQEISQLKNQTRIDLTTKEFLFCYDIKQRVDSGFEKPDKILSSSSSFGLPINNSPTYTPSFTEHFIIYSKMISF